MYPLKKGKFASQAHVGLPQGTYEEEHGRKGFYGKSAHLYHAHPPTGWIRFEGKLRPHCLDLNLVEPSDLNDPSGSPVVVLGNQDVRLYISRRSEPMPFYYRNADGVLSEEVRNFQDAFKPLRKLYGTKPAAAFGPLALKAARQEMITMGWCRNTVNRHIGRHGIGRSGTDGLDHQQVLRVPPLPRLGEVEAAGDDR